MLEELIELARLSPSAANRQRLRFKLVHSSSQNEIVFSTLSWAGYLQDWKGPLEGEKPSAYIIILTTATNIEEVQCDAGIACQSILLGATEKEYGGCIFASVDRKKLKKELSFPNHYQILYVIALGKPKEQVQITKVINNNIKYWRDENGVHYVPKRDLQKLII